MYLLLMHGDQSDDMAHGMLTTSVAMTWMHAGHVQYQLLTLASDHSVRTPQFRNSMDIIASVQQAVVMASQQVHQHQYSRRHISRAQHKGTALMPYHSSRGTAPTAHGFLIFGFIFYFLEISKNFKFFPENPKVWQKTKNLKFKNLVSIGLCPIL